MKLSNKQQEAFDAIMHFFVSSSDSLFVFSGVAGSGKSTIINLVNEELAHLGYAVANLALTGKAAKVMRRKGIYNAQTIHSFLYKPLVDDDGNLKGFIKRPREEVQVDAINIDEGSMLNEEILQDAYDTGAKILVVGDINQLPPIGESDFNIMELCDVRLEEVHRQAVDSPIIQLSQHILSNDTLPSMSNAAVNYINRFNIESHLEKHIKDYGTILCGTNKQRAKLNNASRRFLGKRSRLPLLDDKIICLRNNTKNGAAMFNGDIFYVKKITPHVEHHKGVELQDYMILNEEENAIASVIVDDDVWNNGYSKVNYIDEDVNGNGDVRRIFLDRFDFAYAITVWKSQGSEYDNVLFLDEDVSYFVDRSKFRYTAVTRSKNLLTIAK